MVLWRLLHANPVKGHVHLLVNTDVVWLNPWHRCPDALVDVSSDEARFLAVSPGKTSISHKINYFTLCKVTKKVTRKTLWSCAGRAPDALNALKCQRTQPVLILCNVTSTAYVTQWREGHKYWRLQYRHNLNIHRTEATHENITERWALSHLFYLRVKGLATE